MATRKRYPKLATLTIHNTTTALEVLDEIKLCKGGVGLPSTREAFPVDRIINSREQAIIILATLKRRDFSSFAINPTTFCCKIKEQSSLDYYRKQNVEKSKTCFQSKNFL